MPSFSNSPRIRSAPQSRLFAAISLIKAIVSGDILGCVARAFDWCFQNKRNASRCQRSRVSGWTRNRACFHTRTALAKSTRKMRSLFVHTGRFTCRLRMISCCRKRAFSAMSSNLLRPRSAKVPSGNEELSGLVQ
jgi:hypothetical protein